MNILEHTIKGVSKTLFICLGSVLILLILLIVIPSCNHGGDGGGDISQFVIEPLTKSDPDECFCGIGAKDNGPIINSLTGDCSDLTPEEPLTVCQPKRNYSYIWALAKVGPNVWFGTLPNTLCLGRLGFSTFLPDEPILDDLFVCEFVESHVASLKPVPILGDHRTPQIKVYDTKSGTEQDISVEECNGAELLDTTLGLRQGGSVDTGDFNIVILSGPSLFGGINMFIFDAKNKVCLASKNFPQYNDARKTIVLNGVLYAAVGKTPDVDNPGGGGRVLRFLGDLSNPLEWEEVGKLDTIGANLTFHEGRIYVGTWPNVAGISGPIPADLPQIDPIPPMPGIFMSPIVPRDGLTSDHFDEWTKIWESPDYEPDLATAATYLVGDLASFQGMLWWGTMHFQDVAFLVHSFVYQSDLFSDDCSSDPECSVRLIEATENTKRATALFRGRNFESTPDIELLYGESSLPDYNPSTSQWEVKQNNMSVIPLFGKSGIDNSLNFYTWTMAVFKNQLYLGTYEASLVVNEDPDNPVGGDLFRFTDLSLRAEPVSLDGLGNFLNYGIRSMLSDEDGKNGDDALYIGTANPFNIAPEGGWELLRWREVK